ncbi:hypothetical protein N7475_000317 [Penicillium sp. IBT 31633x]|nr:hypothetical protein N7475_000184 [Penicillium sp. IBT 31633x]KAJ5481505.1 hypothetical protein N7475_000317 [Penicillium sp. IBT 31633x]
MAISGVHMSSHALDLKRAQNKEVSCQVKAFRRQVKKGLLMTQEIEEKRQVVFSLYADAMNDVECWTEYRFPSFRA